MLFDIKPKEKREDLFGRGEELNKLLRALRSEPITLLLGIRRIGKTSLLKVCLNELDSYVYFDLRKLEFEGFSKPNFYNFLSDSMSNLLPREKIKNCLRSIEGLSIFGNQIRFNFQRAPGMIKIFQSLDDWAGNRGERIVLAFDEAQLLRYYKGKLDFESFFAYIYDNLHNTSIVLTGSEVGLLLRYLQIDNPESSLYGRSMKSITLKPFERKKSEEFLISGFRENEVRPTEDFIKKAIGRMDGIVGWLTLLGYRSIKDGMRDETIDLTLEEASKLAEKELKSLRKSSEYYFLALRAISLENRSWSGIKRAVEAWKGIPVTNAQITRTLTNLEAMGIIEKADREYRFLDPITEWAVKRMR